MAGKAGGAAVSGVNPRKSAGSRRRARVQWRTVPNAAGDAMIRSMFALASLPALLAGVVLAAHAQTKSPSAELPPAAKDKAVVESAFTRADLNGDGKVSVEEAARLPAIGAKFDDLDKNKDGSLSLEEFAGGFVTAS